MRVRSRPGERRWKKRHDKLRHSCHSPMGWQLVSLLRAIPFDRKEGAVALFATTLAGVL